MGFDSRHRYRSSSAPVWAGPAILTVYYSGSHGVTQYAVNEWIWGMARDVVGEPNPDGGIPCWRHKVELQRSEWPDL